MDDAVGHLRDFASHFFSRSQVQLNRFTRVALKDAGNQRRFREREVLGRLAERQARCRRDSC